MVSGVRGARGMSVQHPVEVDTKYAGEDVTTLPHRMEARTARVAIWTMNNAIHMPVLMLSVSLHGHPGLQPMPQIQLLDIQKDGSDSLVEPLWMTLLSLRWLRQRKRKGSVTVMETASVQVEEREMMSGLNGQTGQIVPWNVVEDSSIEHGFVRGEQMSVMAHHACLVIATRTNVKENGAVGQIGLDVQ